MWIERTNSRNDFRFDVAQKRATAPIDGCPGRYTCGNKSRARSVRGYHPTTVDNILRFPTAVKHVPAIDARLRAQREDLRPFVETWFERMRRCGSDVRELMHDGCPTACVGDAAFGYVNAFRDHVNVGFFFGALLDDPSRLLEGTGKRGRHVKLRTDHAIDATALAKLVDTAYADIRARLRT
jgi:hypothetical protein